MSFEETIIRRLVGKDRCWHAVYEVCCSEEGINLMFKRQVRFCERLRVVFVMCLCFLLEMPFYSNMCGHVNLCKMSLLSGKDFNDLERYSPPLSVCNCFILKEKRFSTQYLNFMKDKATSHFCWRVNSHENRKKSSINIT